MSTPEVHVQITEYEISVIPEGNLDRQVWGLKVAYRGNGRWAVLRGSVCLGNDGTWDYEQIPSERRDDWLDVHRFDHDTALRLAVEHAPGVVVNGQTAVEVLAWHRDRGRFLG